MILPPMPTTQASPQLASYREALKTASDAHLDAVDAARLNRQDTLRPAWRAYSDVARAANRIYDQAVEAANATYDAAVEAAAAVYDMADKAPAEARNGS